jgi:hypothetical protein
VSSIPAPNIAEIGGQIGAAPQNSLAEYARTAALQAQTRQMQAMAPLQQQQAQQQIEAQRRQFADQDALTKAMAQFDPSKHTLADVPKLITANGGSGQAALTAQAGLTQQRQNLLKLSDEQFAQLQKQADLIQGFHDTVSQAADKPTAYTQGLQQLAREGVDISKEPPQYPGDDVFAQHAPAIRLHSAILGEAEKDREISAKESEAATKAIEAQTTQQKLQAELPGGPLESPDKAELRSYLTSPKVPGESLPVEQRTPASFLAWKAKQSPMAVIANSNLLGPGGQGSALDQQAENYFQTGQLPQGFGRSPQTIAAVIKRANELHPNESIVGNKGIYEANVSSLRNLQKNFDQVSAFENTAGKNLNLYLDKLSAIPDLKYKFANVPLRMIDSKMIGSDNFQAMKAAQQTAAAEAAKVLSSANASGVLSDTQKKEAEDMLSGNLSYSAAQKVVQTLKQDFANRHQSYQMQIGDIQTRMRGKAESTQGTQGTGKTLSMAAIQQAAKDHNVSVDEAKRQAQAAGYTIQ